MDETLKKLYSEIEVLLNEAKNYDVMASEYEQIIGEAKVLAEQAYKLESLRNEKSIEELKQDGEIAKMNNALEVERVKQSIPSAKIALEVFKTITPLIVEGGLHVWGISQMGHFEETGRYTTAFSKIIQNRFPRFWK